MCGRYTQTVDIRKLSGEFEVPVSSIEPLKASYNISPSQGAPILFKNPDPKIELFRWGLIPSWSRDPSIGLKMINARVETLTSKPSFRGLLGTSRCLVLADGFYEWKLEGKRKTPYYIRFKSKAPFSFAGLWSSWVSPEGKAIRSFTIITSPPNNLLTPIHNRMPVILPRKKREVWIDPQNHDSDKLLSLLEPYPDQDLEAYPVSPLVNSSSIDISKCLQEEKDS